MIFQNDYPCERELSFKCFVNCDLGMFLSHFSGANMLPSYLSRPKIKASVWVGLAFHSPLLLFIMMETILTFSILFRLAFRLPSIGQISFGSVVSAIHFVVSLTLVSLSAVYCGSLCRSGQMMAMRIVMHS